MTWETEGVIPTSIPTPPANHVSTFLDSSTGLLSIRKEDGSLISIESQLNGPASSTDNALARFNLTTGKLLQDSLAVLDDLGVLDVPGITTRILTVNESGIPTNTLDITRTASGALFNIGGLGNQEFHFAGDIHLPSLSKLVFDDGAGASQIALIANGQLQFLHQGSPALSFSPGNVNIDGRQLNIYDNFGLQLGFSPDTSTIRHITLTTQTNEHLFAELGTNLGLVIAAKTLAGFDYATPVFVDPHLRVHSGLASTTEWVDFYHDRTNGTIESGSGELVLKDPVNGTKSLSQLSQSRISHIFTRNSGLTGVGPRYLRIGPNIVSSSLGIDMIRPGMITAAGFRVDVPDPNNSYTVEIIKQSSTTPVVIASILLPVGSTSVRNTTLSGAIIAGDELGARVVRTTGTGASVFTQMSLNVEVTV